MEKRITSMNLAQSIHMPKWCYTVLENKQYIINIRQVKCSKIILNCDGEQDIILENYKTYLKSMATFLKAKRCTETHMAL